MEDNGIINRKKELKEKLLNNDDYNNEDLLDKINDNLINSVVNQHKTHKNIVISVNNDINFLIKIRTEISQATILEPKRNFLPKEKTL